METALTFDPKCFSKINQFDSELYLLKPMVEYHNFLFQNFAFNTLLILCENKTKSEYFHGKRKRV